MVAEFVESALIAIVLVFLVIRPFVVQAFYIPSGSMLETLQIDDRVIARAREQIHALAATLGLASDDCRVATGNVKAEILRQAREVGADLIVLGCRERHGLSILVNLTEDTVLHAAPCDVLAMRVR